MRGVLVPAGQQAERGHGLVVGFAVPERFGHARGGGRDDAGVSAVGLRAARQQLGGLAHRAPGQVCRAGAHVPGDGQRERAYRVGLATITRTVPLRCGSAIILRSCFSS